MNPFEIVIPKRIELQRKFRIAKKELEQSELFVARLKELQQTASKYLIESLNLKNKKRFSRELASVTKHASEIVDGKRSILDYLEDERASKHPERFTRRQEKELRRLLAEIERKHPKRGNRATSV